MTGWCRTFGRYMTATQEALDDAGAELVEAISEYVVEDVRNLLHAAGWRRDDLVGPGTPTVTIRTATEHNFWQDGPRLVVFLGEARALELLHPNPFPTVELFPRLAACRRLWRRTPPR